MDDVIPSLGSGVRRLLELLIIQVAEMPFGAFRLAVLAPPPFPVKKRIEFGIGPSHLDEFPVLSLPILLDLRHLRPVGGDRVSPGIAGENAMTLLDLAQSNRL